MGPNAHAVSYVLRNDLLNVVLICPAGSDEKDHEVMLGPQTAEIEEVRKAYSGWDPMLRALLDIPGSEFTKWSLLKTDDVAEWSHQDAKIILIGDAAHAMPPYL